MTEMNKRIFLIDGSAVFYRAYFAFIRNPLINSKGENTSATYGLINSLAKIIRDESPDYLAIAFDTKAPTFRHKMYDEYKSTRAKMPEDLVEQLPRIHQAVEVLNIPSFEMEGYEADDIIGTIAKAAEREGFEVWCVTGDKDYFQLVSDNVGVYYPKKPSEAPDKMKREEVKAKFGVYPELVIDKLALMGDASDNVPGVPGVGAKTADKLLEQFGSLESVLENCDKIKAKGVRQKVTDNIEQARLSQELVTIKTDVPIEYDLESLKRRQPEFEPVKKLFVEMEFTRLLKEFLPGQISTDAIDAKPAPPKTAQLYHTVTTLDELQKLCDAFGKVKEIAVDTETTSISALEAELVGVSLADRAHTAYYVPLGHSGEGEENLPFDDALKIIGKLLANKNVQKIGQNIKYDLEIFHRYGLDIEPISFDTMLASYVLNPSGRRHSLDALAMEHFDYQMQPISDLIGSGKSQKTFDIVPVKTATFYAAEDADLTFQLRGKQAPPLAELELENLYYNIELPLIKVLADMEEAGIKVDHKFLAKLSGKMEKSLQKIMAEIYKIAGGEFNINSTQQLSHILFEKLGLPTKGKTKKKTGYSTDVRVLEELASLHDLPKMILEYRQLTKLKSTYIDAIPRLMNPETGRVHTSFNQTIAATGRLSSTDPNLQNIPIRTEEGRQIRKAFVPRDSNHVLLAADYSQIELRILAHYSDDKGLVSAFKNAEDIHSRTAAEVFGVDLKDVTRQQRGVAKTTNFAVIYGVSAFGLSQQTGMKVDEARQFIETYFARYPGIKTYMDETVEFARENGYVTTMFNRRRYLPEINEKNRNVREFAERTAVNTPIQGTAADIIKKAMIDIHNKMKKMRSKMVLQVHDELVFDVHKEELEDMQELVRIGMEKAVKLKVPVVADMAAGANWLEAK